MTPQERCTGRYTDTKINQQCNGCHRLINGHPAGYWYIKVPEFEAICDKRLAESEQEAV